METLANNKLANIFNNVSDKPQTVNVSLKLKDMNLVLIDGIDFNTSEFEGGVKDLGIIINRITKPFKDAPKPRCSLFITLPTSEIIGFCFDAGKFNANMHTIINSFVQTKLIGNNKDKQLFKDLKSSLLNKFNEKVQGFIGTMQFIDYLNVTPLYEITSDLMQLNSLQIVTPIEITSDAK